MIGEIFWGTIYRAVTGRDLPGKEIVKVQDGPGEPRCCDDGLPYVLFMGLIDRVERFRRKKESRDPLSAGQLLMFATLEETLAGFSAEPGGSRRGDLDPACLCLSYRGERFAVAYGSRLDVDTLSIAKKYPGAEKVVRIINNCVYKDDDSEVLGDVQEKHGSGSG